MKRQITMTLASPSTALDNAQPINAMEPAAIPATRPATPSTVIQTRLAHDSTTA